MAYNKVVKNSKTLIDLTADTIIASHVLAGDKFHDKAGNAVTGTMVSAPTYPNEYTASDFHPYGASGSSSVAKNNMFVQIPKSAYYPQNTWLGYKEDNLVPANVKNGVTIGKGLKMTGTFTSDGTIAAGDVLSGKIGYSKGSKITGTMANRGAVAPSALNAGGSYTIPAGYHNGSGKVTTNSLSSQTSATATAADIVSGKTAYVNGSKVTGTMAVKSDMGDSAEVTASRGSGKVNIFIPNPGAKFVVDTNEGNPYGGIHSVIPTSKINRLQEDFIRKDIEILGVVGTYEGSGTGGIKTIKNRLTITHGQWVYLNLNSELPLGGNWNVAIILSHWGVGNSSSSDAAILSGGYQRWSYVVFFKKLNSGSYYYVEGCTNRGSTYTDLSTFLNNSTSYYSYAVSWTSMFTSPPMALRSSNISQWGTQFGVIRGETVTIPYSGTYNNMAYEIQIMTV